MSDAVPPRPTHPPKRPRRLRPVGWYRGRSLRSRLSMLTAAAVAIAIALSALACWFLVRDRLYEQVHSNLTEADSLFVGPSRRENSFTCDSTPAAALAAARRSPDGIPLRPLKWDIELIAPDGSACFQDGDAHAIRTEPGDLAAIGGHTAGFRDGEYADGTAAVVRVVPIDVRLPNQTIKQYVALVALPIENVQNSLNNLALILLGVVGVGTVGAGFIGRLVARSALKPVDDLTGVVEHIARTEEVGTTIPVHGSDEIARLATSFNSMSTALANSRERQTRLIADAGHELRTPLTSLRTNVDLLIRSDDTGRALPPATRAKMLANMKAQMQELTLLIGDLLQLSRPDSPKPGQNLSVLALHEITHRAVDRARLRGPGLTFELAVEPWYVHGDGPALERAVINLLDNAVKYSPSGGTVEVALRAGRLTVRDHGPGIPAEELPYVFDRFWRSPSSRQLPGSGLGLSIVAQAVRDSGGEVALGPAADGAPGALATLRLPGQPDRPDTDGAQGQD
ncbi:HAMP domain-containing sensor histidine kinase [Kitasatospora sp. NPDC094015]|uniref:sensor histidine kinase n=1 Tax=Kitasatospora sp. NPDC094015 TaxID=3155205 RepID=UPI003328D772